MVPDFDMNSMQEHAEGDDLCKTAKQVLHVCCTVTGHFTQDCCDKHQAVCVVVREHQAH